MGAVVGIAVGTAVGAVVGVGSESLQATAMHKIAKASSQIAPLRVENSFSIKSSNIIDMTYQYYNNTWYLLYCIKSPKSIDTVYTLMILSLLVVLRFNKSQFRQPCPYPSPYVIPVPRAIWGGGPIPSPSTGEG